MTVSNDAKVRPASSEKKTGKSVGCLQCPARTANEKPDGFHETRPLRALKPL